MTAARRDGSPHHAAADTEVGPPAVANAFRTVFLSDGESDGEDAATSPGSTGSLPVRPTRRSALPAVAVAFRTVFLSDGESDGEDAAATSAH